MNRLQVKLKLDRIQKDYPIFINFMGGSMNFDTMYDKFEDAVRVYMRSITEDMGRDLLDQVERADRDQEFRDMMRDEEESIEFAMAFGAMTLDDELFRRLKETVQHCLDTGVFVSKQEEQRRKLRSEQENW